MTSSLRLSALMERARSSLFFVPLVFVVAGGALGVAMVHLDASLDDGSRSLPFVAASTVDSAREILAVVATATITVAGVAFSISLLVLQQAASQYSPRVVHSLFRDPFNRRVMGVALGTFTYALMVLRSVRSPLEEGGEAVIPNVSVGLALVLGVVAILAVVAFIDHNAHTMEVSQVLERVTLDTLTTIDRAWPDTRAADTSTRSSAIAPGGQGHRVLVPESGWIQQLSIPNLLGLVPEGGTVRLETSAGRYAVEGTVLCTIWPEPEDPDEVAKDSASAIEVGPSRTMQQDPTYGIRQIADVALVALSPGVNDPSTAHDAIFHLADVLHRALRRDLPPEVDEDGHGRTIIRTERPTHEAIVKLAFDETRRAAASNPTVCIYLLEALHLLTGSLGDGDDAAREELERQAELVLAGAEHADLIAADLEEVRQAYDRRFGDPVLPPLEICIATGNGRRDDRPL